MLQAFTAHTLNPPLESFLTHAPLSTQKGVLTFIPHQKDYAHNFGVQWNAFRSMQIDSESGQHTSEERFFRETGWTPAWLANKVLLDAGCGAGRFSEIALKYGARVIAADLSEAVYACARTLSAHPPHTHLVIRADIFNLPIQPASLDGVFSLGVLQHTPHPLKAIQALIPFLKPEGRLATWIYEKRTPDIALIQPRTWIRKAVQHWPLQHKWHLSRGLTALFFPVGWMLSWLGRTGERLSHFLPYAARHHLERGHLKRQWDYCVMDTLDWYGPTYDIPQKEHDVIRVMQEAGLVSVQRLPARGMAIVGSKPRFSDH
jgi:SAM-dependent methyltransferase